MLSLLAALLVVVWRHRWGPIAARGWGSLFFSQLGGVLWLVATLAQLQAEALGAGVVHGRALWGSWLPQLGFGMWLSSNLLYDLALHCPPRIGPPVCFLRRRLQS